MKRFIQQHQQHKKLIQILALPVLGTILIIWYQIAVAWYPYQERAAIMHICKAGTSGYTKCTECLDTQRELKGLAVRYSYQYHNCDLSGSQFGPVCDGHPYPSIRTGDLISIAFVHLSFKTRQEPTPSSFAC